MLTLKAVKRDLKENLNKIRKEGNLPAVFYGMGKEAQLISINKIEFVKIWKKAGETSTLEIITPESKIDVLIQEVQVNPVTDEPIHVDFLKVDMNKEIEVAIPLEFIGISEAVKSGLGTLVKVLHEVNVEALPKNLPSLIEVDISKLITVDDQILISDLILPTGVKVMNKENEVVASISLQEEEKEEEIIDLSAIEVEKKGKKDLPDTGEGETESPSTE